MPSPTLEEQMIKQGYKPSEWIGIPEAARRLKMSESGTRGLARAGWIESHVFGSRRMVKIGAVEFMCDLREGRVQPIRAKKQVEPPHETEYDWRKSLKSANAPIQGQGRIWMDPANEDVWVPAERAAEVLVVKASMIRWIARQGRLTRRWALKSTGEEVPVERIRFRGQSDEPGRVPADSLRTMYSVNELERLAAKKFNRGRLRSFKPNDPERPAKSVLIRTKMEPPPGDAFLTRNEAAHFLGVTPHRVSELVGDGRLFGWQAIPGKRGCRLYLSARQIQRYANKPDRKDRREAWLKGQERKPNRAAQQWKPNPFQEDNHIWEPPGKCLKRDYGELYTVRQAAECLGVCTATIRMMRVRGRLQGYRTPNSKQTFNRSRWWFFKKEDVHNIKADREYKRRRKAYWKARNPLLYNDDTHQEPTLQWPDAEYHPHEWNPKQPTNSNPFEELREGMRQW